MNAVSPGPPAPLIRLRRDGQAPLRFLGHLLARQNGGPTHDGSMAGHDEARLPWHDLALYRGLAGGYVVAIVAHAPAGPMRCHALAVETLDEALHLLETHDPADDLCPGLIGDTWDDAPDADAALMLRAGRLHGLRRDVQRQYRIAVGRLLLRIAAE